MFSHVKEFKTGITSEKFNNVIKKVEPPPLVKHSGKDVPTCVSYNLRGMCFKGCNHKANHSPYLKDKDDTLMPGARRPLPEDPVAEASVT